MSYPGQKNIPGVIQKIVNEIPPFINFHEPFAGSASVSTFLSVRSMAAIRFHLNDIDPELANIVDYPPGSVVTVMNALDYINMFIGTPASMNDFIFIDPPYMHGTRPNNTQLYRFEMKAYDHFVLLSRVKLLQVPCMIIHPKCDMYDRMLAGFRQVQITVRYHQKTSREILYMNYPKPEFLHTFTMAGSDSWDRQRIKRKGDRLVQKILALPAIERNYLMDRLKKELAPY